MTNVSKLQKYILSALTFGYIYFNRNPKPNVPIGNNIVSPASGIIINIEKNKIEIFINIYDIHYQHSPVDGVITNIINQTNMYNIIEMESDIGHITIERWAGELARTIYTYVNIGQIVNKGDIIGRILLGSHCSITIPPEQNIIVKPSDHVITGETIIATCQ